MKYKITSVIALIALTTACTPRYVLPICDREAQEWNKFDTVEDVCDTVEVEVIGWEPTGSEPNPKPPTSKPPSEPPKEPPHEPPHKPEKEKGNNGWGNGDQNAPGKSGGHNNAENGPKGDHDGRGKESSNSGKRKN